eukprot:747034-Hanusia_phi.AAC.3
MMIFASKGPPSTAIDKLDIFEKILAETPRNRSGAQGWEGGDEKRNVLALLRADIGIVISPPPAAPDPHPFPLANPPPLSRFTFSLSLSPLSLSLSCRSLVPRHLLKFLLPRSWEAAAPCSTCSAPSTSDWFR